MTRTESNRWNPKQKDYNLKKRYHAHPHRELDHAASPLPPLTPKLCVYLIDSPYTHHQHSAYINRPALSSCMSISLLPRPITEMASCHPSSTISPYHYQKFGIDFCGAGGATHKEPTQAPTEGATQFKASNMATTSPFTQGGYPLPAIVCQTSQPI
jgi:hypothetical protein